MTKYIDKAALVAEIERLKERFIAFHHRDGNDWPLDNYGKMRAYNEVLSFLDTLEVKEVEEEPVSNDLEEAAYQFGNCFESHFELASMSFIKGAKWQKEHILKNDSPPTPRRAD